MQHNNWAYCRLVAVVRCRWFAVNLYSEHAVWISVSFVRVQMGIDENKASDKEKERAKERQQIKVKKKKCRAKEDKEMTFTRISFIRFLLAWICKRASARSYFITSTNLSPNFIKSKNGFFVCNTVCLQSDTEFLFAMFIYCLLSVCLACLCVCLCVCV